MSNAVPKLSPEAYASSPNRVLALWFIRHERLPLWSHLYARRN